MKVLWFSTSPSNASAEFGNDHPGCGWVASLETMMVASGLHQLGICFIYAGNSFKKVSRNGVDYYGIPAPGMNAFKRILNRHRAVIDDEFDSPYYSQVIADFKPDLIHVFGTENGFGKVLMNKFNKVIFHLQGLAAPYYNVYFPPGIHKTSALANDSAVNILRGLTYYHFYNIFSRRATRETEIVRHWKFFMGRTSWDKNYVQTLNPSVKYFHCEELLRQDFFSKAWKPPVFGPENCTIMIGTTINPNVFKGLDLVYKVLDLLKDRPVTWNIYGVSENSSFNRIVKKSLHIKSRNISLHFHGPVAADNLLVELNKCHLFVHPSYIDNSPNSVCEAMLLGMPVIASAVGGIKSIVTNEVDGFLFNPQDKYDLAGLIVALMNDYPSAVAIGAAARRTAMKRHDGTRIVASLHKIYEAVEADTTS